MCLCVQLAVGISSAVSVRVGNSLGAGKPMEARKSTIASVVIGSMYSRALVGVVIGSTYSRALVGVVIGSTYSRALVGVVIGVVSIQPFNIYYTRR